MKLCSSQQVKCFSSSMTALKATPLLSRHEQLGGNIVPFAGYKLPVFYKGESGGVLKEHLHTRNQASLFDVSHMGQVRIRGKDRVKFMETLICADLLTLKEGSMSLTVFTNEQGGVIDDAIIANAGDKLHLVVNGACKDKDYAHMKKHRAAHPNWDVDFEFIEEATLMALQGPRAVECLEKLKVKVDFSTMDFMTGLDNVDIAGVKCRLTRCGYTGEDGFEISCEQNGPQVFDALLAQSFVHPCGLGARDSLRLEAGLCLYGHELNETINPREAGLMWVIPKARRTPDRTTFLGSSHVLDATNQKQRRVGFEVESGPPVRDGTKLFFQQEEVGFVSSGCPSPTLGKSIGMGYVRTPGGNMDLTKLDTKLMAQVRGKFVPVKVAPLPFVKPKYFKSTK